jgi:signal transduction histidine kinase
VSIRARLLLVSLPSLAFGLGLLLLVGNLLLRSGVRAQATTVLRARADAQRAALAVGPHGIRARECVTDEALDRSAWVLTGDRLIERPPHVDLPLDGAAKALGRLRGTAERDAPEDVRLLAAPVVDPRSGRAVGAVVVGYPMAALEHVQHEVVLGSIVFALLVLIGGGLATAHALNGALRPVAQMTERAEDWSAHDLDQRFRLCLPRDELTGLAATLDGLLARIAASRRHEQRFASEVAHELRTPIAGLRAGAELALSAGGPGAGAEREAALRAVVEDTMRLDREIEALLALARRELDPSSGSVDLAAVAATVPDVEVVARESVPAAEGEPDIVRRALAPLLDNARRHARQRVVLEVSRAGDRVRLAVRDDGPGLDPALGERAFDPGAARANPARARASACRSPAASRARAVATSSSRRVRAAASFSSFRPSAGSRSGRRHGTDPTLCGHEHHRHRNQITFVRPHDAEQGARGDPLVLGHQDHVHHRRRDRGRLPERQSRLRPDEHDLRVRRTSRRAPARPVPAQALRAAGLLGRRRRDQRVRHAHHRQHDRPLPRPVDDEHADLRRHPRDRLRGLVRVGADAVDPHDHHHPPRRSTGWRSSSRSRAAPPRATSSPSSTASATGRRPRSGAASSRRSAPCTTDWASTPSSRSGWRTS